MRLNRNSVLFIALLVVVIVIALIFMQDGDNATDGSPTAEPTVASVQLFPNVIQDDVTALTIIEQVIAQDADSEATPEVEASDPSPSTATIALIRDSETRAWSIGEATTQPITGTVNSSEINGIVTALVTLRSNRQFTPPDGDYSQFGLDTPSYEITFTEVTETSTDYRLRVGNRTVGENAYYALLGDDDEVIYVVTNATTLQNSILNLTQQVPLEPTASPTLVPLLNTLAPFAEYILTAGNGFVLSNTETGGNIIVTRNADNTAWIYTQNGTELPVQQESLQVILNNFSTISGVDQVATDDLATLGLESPRYIFEASTVDGTVYTLQLGNQDPTGSVYYGLVDDFEEVVLIDSDSVVSFVSLFETPPPLLAVEVTPEATED